MQSFLKAVAKRELDSREGRLPHKQQHQRARCQRCGRPRKVCLCDSLPLRPIETHTAVVVLQHPEEAKKGIRTCQLLVPALKSVQVFVGTSFDSGGPSVPCSDACFPVLLFPGEDAIPLDRPGGPERLAQLAGPDKRIVLVAIDGTWRKAKAVYKGNRQLWTLPKVAMIDPPPERIYHSLRAEPSVEMLSTLESVAVALELIEGVGDGALQAALTRPLRRFVEQQHGFQNEFCQDLRRSKTRAMEVDASLTRRRVLENFERAAAARKAEKMNIWRGCAARELLPRAAAG
jgi:DTW domain-containing protein YfiP